MNVGIDMHMVMNETISSIDQPILVEQGVIVYQGSSKGKG